MAMVAFAVLFGALLSLARALQGDTDPYWNVSGIDSGARATTAVVQGTSEPADTPAPSRPQGSPTPDDPHPLPDLRTEVEEYVVLRGDTLGQIAERFGISLQQLISANSIENPNLVEVGQLLLIPAPSLENAGPAYKIIPNSELVYGPAASDFNVEEFVQQKAGYLASYHEEVEGRTLNGAQIVTYVAQSYSVNPRLLLAVLEYNSGWVIARSPHEATLDYPIGLRDPYRKGLYRQLAWAANRLNRGYYLWRVSGANTWLLGDGGVIVINPTINAGTAGVQQFYASLFDRTNWERAVTEGGLAAAYIRLFGDPFQYAVEPLLPPDLTQPEMRLPFAAGEEWAFTGGPHGGWGDGSAWAAIDFAPPGPALGCVQNDAFVTAVADGPIIRSANGAVIQDIEVPGGPPADGLETTGWVVFYLHIETRDRVAAGAYLKAGDRIGHPSCEGGVSTGTHVHLARRYNGEWIPADQLNLAFVLDGWVSSGAGNVYDGYMKRNGIVVEAYAGRSATNAIQR
jgi:LasA protease